MTRLMWSVVWLRPGAGPAAAGGRGAPMVPNGRLRAQRRGRKGTRWRMRPAGKVRRLSATRRVSGSPSAAAGSSSRASECPRPAPAPPPSRCQPPPVSASERRAGTRSAGISPSSESCQGPSNPRARFKVARFPVSNVSLFRSPGEAGGLAAFRQQLFRATICI